MFAVDPLVSTSLGSAAFLLGLILTVWRFEEMEFEEPETCFSPATVYMTLIFLVLFSVTITYIGLSIAIGASSISPQSIAWAKYVEWAFSSPAMLAGILLLTKNRETVMEALIAQGTLIMTGFAAGIMTGTIQYFLWALAFFSLGIVLHRIWVKGREEVQESQNQEIQNKYYQLALLVGGLWALYVFYVPLSYEGLGIVSFEMSRFVFTGLDIVAKLGFTIYLIKSLPLIHDNLT